MSGAASLVAVGTELVADGRPDANGDWLARALAQAGVEVRFRCQVGDDIDAIARALDFAGQRAPLVIVTGGLGPTVDDVTREAVSRLYGLPMTRQEALVEGLRSRYARLGRTLSTAGERQAFVPAGATVLDNPVGSAPGLLIHPVTAQPATVVLLPGVPAEMERIFNDSVAPRLAGLPGMKAEAGDGQGPAWILMKCSGLTETEAQERILPALDPPEGEGVALTLLASPGEITVILRSTGRATVAGAADAVRAALGPHRFTEDPAMTLELAVAAQVAASGSSLAVAESCTGGLLSALLTRAPGASMWFRQGWVTYANASKRELLGVQDATLLTHGAVSAEVAHEMAAGAISRSGADLAISITGIAGPGGDTPGKPVGLVYIGLADRGGISVSRHTFAGSRDTIRRLAAARALHRLRLRLGPGEGAS